MESHLLLDERVSDSLLVCRTIAMTRTRVFSKIDTLLHRGGKRGPVLEFRGSRRHSVYLRECSSVIILSGIVEDGLLYISFANKSRGTDYCLKFPPRFAVMIEKIIAGADYEKAYAEVYFIENKKEN